MKRKLLTIILITVSSFTLIAAVNAAGTEESDAIPDLYEYQHDPYADLNHEVHELPNLDVIFTFDNEIINWYYRRF